MKKILLFLSLFLAFQIGTAQETWNACNSTVNIIPAPSYDSTFVLEAPSRAALQKGMANWVPASSGGASYLFYTALLTQSGTDAPTATVLENTLGGTVTYSRESNGVYRANLTGAFSTSNTMLMPSIGMSGGVPIFLTYSQNAVEPNYVEFTIVNTTGAAQEGDDFAGLYFEIRVYN